jgi:hypothetical protein
MASKRLALAACNRSHKGPWTRARGNEVGVLVTDMSSEESVRVTIDRGRGDNHETVYLDSPGTFQLEFEGVERYMVEKHGSVSPTTVEILLK